MTKNFMSIFEKKEKKFFFELILIYNVHTDKYKYIKIDMLFFILRKSPFSYSCKNKHRVNDQKINKLVNKRH